MSIKTLQIKKTKGCSKMKHEKKVEWMSVWAAKNNLQLTLEGECGFGRECVGVMSHGIFPDYVWYDDDYNRIDNNSDHEEWPWTPGDAYHKHPCVAVLGRGEVAEAQLYEWLKWFDDNNFKLETGIKPNDQGMSAAIWAILGGGHFCRMVKQHTEEE